MIPTHIHTTIFLPGIPMTRTWPADGASLGPEDEADVNTTNTFEEGTQVEDIEFVGEGVCKLIELPHLPS